MGAQACRLEVRVRAESGRLADAAMAWEAVARAVVRGIEAIARAEMGSQMFVRMRGWPGVWRALRVVARCGWGAMVGCYVIN